MMAEVTRNLLIYPTLVINDGVSLTVRKIDPLGPDQVEITAWALAPREESANLLARRIDSFLTFYGPGGFATPDDIEALEACQVGCSAGEPAYSDISRGMQRDQPPPHVDEAQMRAFWRQWDADVRGLGPRKQTEARGPANWRRYMEPEYARAIAAQAGSTR
jgi:p-cumate 2,3-dioxygenase alpha subunit